MPQFSKYEMHFYIDGEGEKEGGADTTTSKATKQVTDPTGTDFKDVTRKVAGYYAGVSLARTAVKTGVSLIDTYTGNDYEQRVISGVISIGEELAGLVGITIANPAAGAVMAVGKVISLGAEAERNKKDIYVQGLSAEWVRDRAGGAFNRSRINGRY